MKNLLGEIAKNIQVAVLEKLVLETKTKVGSPIDFSWKEAKKTICTRRLRWLHSNCKSASQENGKSEKENKFLIEYESSENNKEKQISHERSTHLLATKFIR